tara:strand:+ start:326 stop:550 length:225 start_codon:yes stop_codon:yes gene_type:complete
MPDNSIKLSLEQFETTLSIYVEHYTNLVIAKGYSEDEIVAIDLEEEDVLFYMSDCKIIRIKKTPIATVGKIAEA